MAVKDPRMGLPFRPFLYTLDQIADLLAVDSVKRFVHFDGRSLGVAPPDKLKACNIAPAGERPEWRIEEVELIRWFHRTGFRPISRINWYK